jgi:hypothetical protein
MKYVVFYETADGAMPKLLELFPAHQARWQGYAERGELLMIGPFANAQEDGAMGIFTTRESAESFVSGDPFVLEGGVKRWYIREWREALVNPSPKPNPGTV